MATLCTAQDVTDRCGPNANATIIASDAIVERYIDAAEQTIVAETRIAWIAEYASVLDSTKETLRLCTASHAAKEIIGYDMDSFNPYASGVTAMNLQENTFQRTLKALKDLLTTKLRSVAT